MFLIYIFTLSIAFLYLFKGNRKKSTGLFLFSMFVLTYIGTFAYFIDDYQPYVDLTEDIYVNPLAYYHIEHFWVLVIESFKGDVDLFRFALCVAFLILFIFCGRILNSDFTVLLPLYILLCYGGHICWLRQPILYFVFILGCIFYGRKKYIISLSLFVFMFLIHKSAILICLALPFLFVRIDLNKNVIFFILLFPVLLLCYRTLVVFLQEIMNIDLEYYLTKEASFSGRSAIVKVTSYLRVILNIWLIIRMIKLYRSSSNKDISLFVRLLFGVLYICLFLFFIQLVNDTFVTRILGLAQLLIIYILGIEQPPPRKKCNLGIYFPLLLLTLLDLLSILLQNYTRIDLLLKLP